MKKGTQKMDKPALFPVFSMFMMTVFILIVLTANKSEARFFQQHSTWYEKVPSNAPLMPNSANYVNDILINSSRLGINYREWSVAVWYAKADTPFVKVDTGSDTRPVQYGWDTVPIPPEATPPGVERGHDGHMVVISHDRRYEWDFYKAKKDSNGKWFARHLRRWDLTTDGINSPYDLKGSAHACPSPLTHGLITYDEIQRGYIDHAIAFSYWGAMKKSHRSIYPCEKSTGGVSDRPWAMLLGERLQLDPTINVDSLPLNRAGKIIAKAMQEYGMIFSINCGKGCNSVYAESLDDKPESWKGILGSLSGVPLNRLKVLKPIIPSTGDTSTGTVPTTPSGLLVGP